MSKKKKKYHIEPILEVTMRSKHLHEENGMKLILQRLEVRSYQGDANWTHPNNNHCIYGITQMMALVYFKSLKTYSNQMSKEVHTK